MRALLFGAIIISSIMSPTYAKDITDSPAAKETVKFYEYMDDRCHGAGPEDLDKVCKLWSDVADGLAKVYDVCYGPENASYEAEKYYLKCSNGYPLLAYDSFMIDNTNKNKIYTPEEANKRSTVIIPVGGILHCDSKNICSIMGKEERIVLTNITGNNLKILKGMDGQYIVVTGVVEEIFDQDDNNSFSAINPINIHN